LIERFLDHKLGVGSAIFVVLIGIIAAAAPIVAPHNPVETNLTKLNSPPTLTHPLGTDQVGRDVLSRIIFATRVSFLVGLGVVAVQIIVGGGLGLISGYFGGTIGFLIQRLTEIVMSFPPILLLIIGAVTIGHELPQIILILGITRWTTLCRVMRGEVLSIRESEFIESAKAIGSSKLRIMAKHILPNTIAVISVNASFGMAQAIISEATLSFLGLGIPLPTPTWGNMLKNAQSTTVLLKRPWLWLSPGLAIVVTVLSINFIGDALRDASDPYTNEA